MSSQAELSDFEDNLLLNDRNDADEFDTGGYASDEAIEDANVQDDDKTDESKKRRVDPKTSQKRTTQNPQVRIHAELLKGPKGIHTIEKHFEDFKFRGKGHEKSDLNRMMKKLEYWSHRLIPKFEFDGCLKRLEVLGTKNPVKTHLTKIRMDLLTDDDLTRTNAGEEDERVVEDPVPIDEFDALIAGEFEKQQTAATPRQQSISLSTGSNETPVVANTTPKAPLRSSDIVITAEMRENIERNRQVAIRKRLARIDAEKARKQALQEQGDENLGPIDQEKNKETQPEESTADSIGGK